MSQTDTRVTPINNRNPDIRREAMELRAWAGTRRCLLCPERGNLHVPHKITTGRGPRLALLRGEGREKHEFDPGERRRR